MASSARRLLRHVPDGCVPFLLSLVLGFALSFWAPSTSPAPQQIQAGPWRIAPASRTPRTPILYHINHTDQAPLGSAARLLRERVRLLCWLLTGPATLASRARHVAATWGRRCDRLLLVSSRGQGVALNLTVAEHRNALWAKTKAALVELHARHLEEYEWFFKADDDTYAVVENLRFFLLDKDPSQPLYFGYPFKVYVTAGYMSGGAGYVLSREALRRVVELGLMGGLCRPDAAGSEDVELGHCLFAVGAVRGDTRDALGRNRFFPLRLDHFMQPKDLPLHWWIWRYSTHPIRPGRNCCSDTAVAFHYLTPKSMYLYEFFVYHAQVLGGPDRRVHPRRQPPPTEL